MSCVDMEDHQVLVNRRLVMTSKRLAEPFEEAYQWMRQSGIQLDSRETVGTIAFSRKGETKVSHLTWSELIELHYAYERLDRIEKRLKARDSSRRLEPGAANGERE